MPLPPEIRRQTNLQTLRDFAADLEATLRNGDLDEVGRRSCEYHLRVARDSIATLEGAPRSERVIAAHLAAYHGFNGVGNDPQEAAAANYCATLAEFHQELHNPDFYHDTGEDAPTHAVEDVWTA